MLPENPSHIWTPKMVKTKHQYIMTVIFLFRSFMFRLFYVFQQLFFLIVKTLTKKVTIVTTLLLSYNWRLFFSTFLHIKPNNKSARLFHYLSWYLNFSHFRALHAKCCTQDKIQKINSPDSPNIYVRSVSLLIMQCEEKKDLTKRCKCSLDVCWEWE